MGRLSKFFRNPFAGLFGGSSREDQLVDGPQRRRQQRGIEACERTTGLVEPPEEQEAARSEISRMRGVHQVAVRFERPARRVERFCGPPQVA